MRIKAIETRYSGRLFRSRLEARWAVLFDAAGIEYQYEPEGYWVSDFTAYLPDFLLREIGIFVEIKPPNFHRRGEFDRELVRFKVIQSLWNAEAAQNPMPLCLIAGEPRPGGYGFFLALDEPESLASPPDGWELAACRRCSGLDITREDYGHGPIGKHTPKCIANNDRWPISYDAEYRTAMEYRFEHRNS